MENCAIHVDIKGTLIVCSDTKENCFIQLLRYLTNHDYTIYGMRRTARGNSHDENWQHEYTVINGGGPFADKFQEASEQGGNCYYDKPSIVRMDTLSDEYMKEWSKPFEYYSGEESNRYIYVDDEFGKTYIYETSNVFAKPIDKMSHKQEMDWMRNILGVWFLKAMRMEEDR